ncbi:MAG: hypothetical protein QM831_16360 [Kofleriaceae bacterium]
MGEDTVRLVGRVVEVSDPAPGFYAIRVDKKAHPRTVDGSFVLEVDSRRVKIETLHTTFHGEVSGKGEGSWRDLKPTLPLDGDYPAFKKTTFTATCIQPGDQVALLGRVMDRAVDEADYRESPVSHVSRVQAEFVARGADAEDALAKAIRAATPAASRVTKRATLDVRRFDPGSPRFRHALGDWQWSAYAVALAIILYVCGVHQRILMAILVAVAITARPTVSLPNLRSRAERRGISDGLPWEFGVAMVATAPVLGIQLGYTALRIAALAVATMSTSLMIYRLIRLAPLMRLARNPTVVGIVRDPTPAQLDGKMVAVGREENYQEKFDTTKHVDELTSKQFVSKGTFFVGDHEIDPDEMIWASTVRESHEGFYTTYKETIPIGGKVAAFGWIAPDSKPPKLVARGTHPVVVVATSQNGEPLALVRRLLIDRYIDLAVLVTTVAICVRG